MAAVIILQQKQTNWIDFYCGFHCCRLFWDFHHLLGRLWFYGLCNAFKKDWKKFVIFKGCIKIRITGQKIFKNQISNIKLEIMDAQELTVEEIQQQLLQQKLGIWFLQHCTLIALHKVLIVLLMFFLKINNNKLNITVY